MEISLLPRDVLDAILLRVSFGTLVDCVRVCKRWRRAILDESFKDKYLPQSMAKRRVLFLYVGEADEKLFQTVSQEEPSLLLSSKRQLRFHSDEELEMVSQPQQGVVCFSLETQFLLCNLGTKKCKTRGGRRCDDPPLCKTLPKPEGDEVYFFGCDESGGSVFKLLRVSHVNVARGGGGGTQMPPPPMVLTVKLAEEESYSWRSIDTQLSYTPVTDSRCINGVLYYGAWPFFHPNTYKQSRASMVITFNLESEGFGLIDLPDGLQISQIVDMSVKYQGNFYLVKNQYLESDDGTRGYVIFVKDENKYKMKPLIVAIPRWRDVAEDPPVLFKGTSENGELVFATQSALMDGSHYLLYYNAETQHLRKHKIEGGSPVGDVETYLDHYDSLLLT